MQLQLQPIYRFITAREAEELRLFRPVLPNLIDTVWLWVTTETILEAVGTSQLKSKD